MILTNDWLVKNIQDCLYGGTLNLSFNEIDEIDSHTFEWKDCIHVKKLYLTSNNIRSLHPNTFIPLINLEEIYLDENKIHEIDDIFSENTKLETIHLSRNNFTSFPRFSGKIKSLDLSENKIKSVSQESFYGLGLLERLWLDNNQIERFKPYVLQQCLGLRLLSIRYNPCWIIELSDFYHGGLKDLKELYMGYDFYNYATDIDQPPIQELKI